MSSDYFDYLMNISWKGKLYRRHFVYPLIKRHSKGNLLDVGCGTGLFLEFYKNGTGVDINSDCVAFCKQNGLNAIHMDLDVLPFENGSFDTIVLDNVLEHIEDPEPILKECHRALSDEGRIIALTPGRKGYKRDSDHKVYYDLGTLPELLEKNGFKRQFVKNVPFWGLERFLSAFCFFAVAIKKS